MTTSKQYDDLNRLTGLQSSAGVLPVAAFNYSYNPANQRTSTTNAPGVAANSEDIKLPGFGTPETSQLDSLLKKISAHCCMGK